MAAFEDLTEYTYSDWDEPMVNVGWLGQGTVFETGPVSGVILDELVLMADKKSNVMRGLHDCEFCDTESPIVWPAPVERGSVYLGTGELHVRGRDGTLYSAPSLVIHYITDHHYRPPVEFLGAVRLAAAERASAPSGTEIELE